MQVQDFWIHCFFWKKGVSLPIATVTNSHMQSGLEQHGPVSSQFLGADLPPQPPPGQNHGVSRSALFLQPLEEKLSPACVTSRDTGVPWLVPSSAFRASSAASSNDCLADLCHCRHCSSCGSEPPASLSRPLVLTPGPYGSSRVTSPSQGL